ncbi:MAG: hypothetical protein Q8K65_10370 [Alphaproteobacteria bacterium]|nr:hypothetical protein [Alphaproteobacteria bacterium]
MNEKYQQEDRQNDAQSHPLHPWYTSAAYISAALALGFFLISTGRRGRQILLSEAIAWHETGVILLLLPLLLVFLGLFPFRDKLRRLDRNHLAYLLIITSPFFIVEMYLAQFYTEENYILKPQTSTPAEIHLPLPFALLPIIYAWLIWAGLNSFWHQRLISLFTLPQELLCAFRRK